MIEKALATFLKAQTDVTNVIGDRITLERKKRDGRLVAPPEIGNLAITLGRVSTNRQYALSGEVNAAPAIVRLTIYAKGGPAVEELFNLFEIVRQHLSGYRGDWDDIYVHGCTWETEGTEAEAPTDSSDYWDFSYGVDMRVTYRQPAISVGN